MKLLTISNLNITFGDSTVVKNVSLTVEKGEVLAIVGESGSGKSLTAQAILQLLPGNAKIEGSITLNTSTAVPKSRSESPSPLRGEAGRGAELGTASPTNLLTLSEREITKHRGRDVGMIFQEPMTALNPLHPISKQIIEGYCVHQKISPKSAAAKTKLLELFAAVGLQHLQDRGTIYPHQLSGGERQRVMIAMAIANDPALLIADEPTTALDVTLVGQILSLLKQLQTAKNMGLIFITHDLLMVQQIADRVAVMKAGEIVETGPVKEVFKNPQHAYTKMLLAATPSGSPAPIKTGANKIISCNNLSVTFPVKSPILRRTLRVVEAVKNASFTLHAGETLGVVGESGSGKSSLGYALLRLIKSEGPIVFLGNRLDRFNAQQLRAARSDMQIVFQDPFSSLNPRMSVGEIIAEGLKLHGVATPHGLAKSRSDSLPPEGGVGGGLNEASASPMPPPQPSPSRGGPLALSRSRASTLQQTIDIAVDEILHQVGLTPEMKHRYPHEFSGGQRQRIAIARSMVLKPKLVVLDEPTSALDMSVQKQVLELLKSIQASHDVAYIFISHDLRTVRSMAHQVLVLKRGEIVESGSSEKLFAAPKHDYTKRLFAAAFGAAI